MANNLSALSASLSAAVVQYADMGEAAAGKRVSTAILYLASPALDVFAWPRALRDAVYVPNAEDFGCIMMAPVAAAVIAMAHGERITPEITRSLKHRLARCAGTTRAMRVAAMSEGAAP